MEGEWSCYRGGQFNGWRIVITEVASVMEGEWSCYGDVQYKEGEWLLQRRPV